MRDMLVTQCLHPIQTLDEYFQRNILLQRFDVDENVVFIQPYPRDI
jgi:hypothetical protein